MVSKKVSLKTYWFTCQCGIQSSVRLPIGTDSQKIFKAMSDRHDRLTKESGGKCKKFIMQEKNKLHPVH